MKQKGFSIGLHQAKRMCQISHNDRLKFLSKGLPIILSSAQSLWKGSQKLENKMPREAALLRNLAEEEAAKALILIDLVRCPKAIVNSRIGRILHWFYDHLARIIYANSVSWKPTNVRELRQYVDESRKDYYIEGYVGEYILPNQMLYMREVRFYADVQADDLGHLSWSNPIGNIDSYRDLKPMVILLIEAMSMFGMFTPNGLNAISEVWGKIEFSDEQGSHAAEKLNRKLLLQLIKDNLPSGKTKQEHTNRIYEYWQLPMYNLDLHLLKVSQEEIIMEQASEIASEFQW